MIPTLAFLLSVIFNMLKIFVCTCLLSSALSVVEMKKLLNINGRAGESVTFKCSDWDVWTDVTTNEKYFCDSPCTDDKHIIVRAAFGETEQNNRIKITNRADGLSVTFTNLQKSDSKTYYCRVDRAGIDPSIMVNLQVTDASPKKTPKTAIVDSTLSFAVTNSPSVSSSSSDIITDMSASYTTLNTTTPTALANPRAGSVPYLIIGVVVILTMLMVLLKIVSKMRRKQRKVVPNADTTQEDAQGDVEYEDIRPEDQTDPDCFYANYSYHQESAAQCSYTNDVSLNSVSRFEDNSRWPSAESRVTYYITHSPGCDLIYSVAQLPKEQNEPTVQSELNQSESYKNDFLYSLAQQPQAT